MLDNILDFGSFHEIVNQENVAVTTVSLAPPKGIEWIKPYYLFKYVKGFILSFLFLHAWYGLISWLLIAPLALLVIAILGFFIGGKFSEQNINVRGVVKESLPDITTMIIVIISLIVLIVLTLKYSSPKLGHHFTTWFEPLIGKQITGLINTGLVAVIAGSFFMIGKELSVGKFVGFIVLELLIFFIGTPIVLAYTSGSRIEIIKITKEWGKFGCVLRYLNDIESMQQCFSGEENGGDKGPEKKEGLGNKGTLEIKFGYGNNLWLRELEGNTEYVLDFTVYNKFDDQPIEFYIPEAKVEGYSYKEDSEVTVKGDVTNCNVNTCFLLPGKKTGKPRPGSYISLTAVFPTRNSKDKEEWRKWSDISCDKRNELYFKIPVRYEVTSSINKNYIDLFSQNSSKITSDSEESLDTTTYFQKGHAHLLISFIPNPYDYAVYGSEKGITPNLELLVRVEIDEGDKGDVYPKKIVIHHPEDLKRWNCEKEKGVDVFDNSESSNTEIVFDLTKLPGLKLSNDRDGKKSLTLSCIFYPPPKPPEGTRYNRITVRGELKYEYEKTEGIYMLPVDTDNCISSSTIPVTPEPSEIEKKIIDTACKKGVPPDLALAIAFVETRIKHWDDNGNVIVNEIIVDGDKRRYIGVMQVNEESCSGNPFELDDNIECGIEIIHKKCHMFENSCTDSDYLQEYPLHRFQEICPEVPIKKYSGWDIATRGYVGWGCPPCSVDTNCWDRYVNYVEIVNNKRNDFELQYDLNSAC